MASLNFTSNGHWIRCQQTITTHKRRRSSFSIHAHSTTGHEQWQECSSNNQYTDTILSLNSRNLSITIAENDPHEGKRKIEALWPIFRLHHQRSRYVYELYYKREAISKELYEYLLKQGYADANLIAKWKKVHILRDHLNNIETLRICLFLRTRHGSVTYIDTQGSIRAISNRN